MQPKIILSPAWAAQEGMLDSALASLFDIDLSDILTATDNNMCPRCGNPPADSKAQLLTNDPAAATPENVSGYVIVRCLCETVYAYAYVHEVDAQQPLGQARVRASVAPPPKPAVPPLTSWAPVYEHESPTGRRHGTMDSNDVVLEAHRQRRQVSPALWVSLASPQWARVASTNHLRQSQAADQPPDSPNAEPGEAR